MRLSSRKLFPSAPLKSIFSDCLIKALKALEGKETVTNLTDTRPENIYLNIPANRQFEVQKSFKNPCGLHATEMYDDNTAHSAHILFNSIYNYN